MAAKHSLGTPLLAIGLGTFALIAGLVLVVAAESFRQIESSTRAQTRSGAFQRIEMIRERIVEVASTQPAASLEEVFCSHSDLSALLARQAASDEIYQYVTIVNASGRLVARGGPVQTGDATLSPFLVDKRVLDYSVPIDLDGKRVGEVYVGISQDLLESRIAGAHYPIRRVLVPLVLACLAVLAAGGGASWWLIHRAREVDREAARQEHLAEVGKLASGLAHEIRNPLNAMRMQIAVVRKKLSNLDDPDVRVAGTQLERLEHEVLRVQDLTKEFLAFGRPASDSPDVIDLGALVCDVVEFIRAEFQQAGLRVSVKVDDDSRGVFVRMDRDKLRQVLLNLAENAKEAMPNGGDLAIRVFGRANRDARIEVSDTGGGIPVDQLPRIFDAFYSTKDEGSGLGLAIVKQIIEAAGGRVDVVSEVGRGTRFEIHLPRVATAAHAELSEVLR